MSDRNDPERATFLGRLFHEGIVDEEAWREFVVQYGRQIYKWCRHWGLRDADAEDVTQRCYPPGPRMKGFVYDPRQSFRVPG